jgi:hypothetical protein
MNSRGRPIPLPELVDRLGDFLQVGLGLFGRGFWGQVPLRAQAKALGMGKVAS